MRLFVGLDWGHEHMQVVVETGTGDLLWKERCESRGQELDRALRKVGALAAEHGAGVTVGIERNGGRLVDRLFDEGLEVCFVPPSRVDDARKLLFSSMAKDDLRDAKTIAWILRSMPQHAAPISRPSEIQVDLRRATRAREHLVTDRTALQSQVLEVLREKHPDVADLGELRTTWFREFLRLVPSPRRARDVPEAEVRALLKRHRVTKISPEEILTKLRSSAVVGSSDRWTVDLELMLERLELVERQIRQYERIMEECTDLLHEQQQTTDGSERPTDVEIVRSLPGAGAVLAPKLLAERLPELVIADLEVARAVSGVAPLRCTTGMAQTRNRGRVAMRYACNGHLRNALHLLVEKGMQQDEWLRHRYANLRARGHTHGRACRQIADGLLHRLRAMLRDRTLYRHDTSPSPAAIAV